MDRRPCNNSTTEDVSSEEVPIDPLAVESGKGSEQEAEQAVERREAPAEKMAEENTQDETDTKREAVHKVPVEVGAEEEVAAEEKVEGVEADDPAEEVVQHAAGNALGEVVEGVDIVADAAAGLDAVTEAEAEAEEAEEEEEEDDPAVSNVSVCPGPLGLILDKRQPNRAVVIGFDPLPSGVCGELEYHPACTPGSVIVAVNGIDTSAMPMAQVMELLASSQFAEDRVISFMNGEVKPPEVDGQEEEEVHLQKEEYKILYDPDMGIKLTYSTSYRATYVGWASKFDQIVALSEHGFAVLDLKTRKEQSRWTYSSVRNISLEDDAVGFALTLQKEGNQMSTLKYRSQYRLQLLSDLVRLRDLSIGASLAVRASRQYAALKVRRSQLESELFLEITPCSLNQVACDADKTTLSRYLYKDMQVQFSMLIHYTLY
jgi:hypothetical protein